jgi:hypothetical protein
MNEMRTGVAAVDPVDDRHHHTHSQKSGQPLSAGLILGWETDPMFFVTAIRSAAGAATYFAKDNYYTQGENAELSAWGGQGAAALGLAGIVDKDTFEGS